MPDSFCPFFSNIGCISHDFQNMDAGRLSSKFHKRGQSCFILRFPWDPHHDLLVFDCIQRGSVENVECGVWKVRSVENAECGKCGVWKVRSVESAECGKCRTFQFQYEINK